MYKRMCRMAAGWIAAAILFSMPAEAAPVVSAQSAILIDAATGRVQWEYNAHTRSLIASTTKIMTGLLIAEDCDLNACVRIPSEAVGIEGSSLYLKTGEVLTVEALLYGMMLHSGNDAATALALYHSGSLEAFAIEMNRKAADLGLENTHFSNPHGLDSEENYATARDLAVLAAYAMENPVFFEVVSAKTAVFGQRQFTNHNKLLWRYEGAVGVKTGYTRSAGRILVSCAQRDGRRLIAVTLDDPNDWQDHGRIFDYGFSAYSQRTFVEAGLALAEVPVIGGAEKTAQAVLREDISYPLAEGEQWEVVYHVPEFVYPPVLAGERAGEAMLLIDGKEMVIAPLYWRDSVMEGA